MAVCVDASHPDRSYTWSVAPVRAPFECSQMEHHLQAIVTVLSLVNPLICGTMFAQVEAGQTRATRLADATKAALAVLVILVIAALAGARVLQVFGVSLDAFSIAGGGVLTWIGFSMLRGNSLQAQDPSKNRAAETRSLGPVILFAASPGTITGVITLAVAHAKLALPITALVAVVVATLVMWVVMALVAHGGSRARDAGGLLNDMVTRFMGLIVIAMGVQFALTGFHNFFG
jgi:small neutral amino acid transporter SnatA (MarC family)